MSACLSPEVISRIALGDSLVEPGDEQHAKECAHCAERVSFVRQCIASGIAEIDDEAREVDALLADLRRERPAVWPRIINESRFHHPGLVRRLVALALIARDSNTRLALDYSKAATKIVEVLPAREGDIADLRFDAWRHHSMLLREAGQYDSCREAFVIAGAAAADITDPELSEAIMLLSRALLAIEPDVWEPAEGRALLDRAEHVFARRDPDRLIRTKTVRGMLARRAGDYEEAASIFAEILAMTARENEHSHSDALGNYLSAAIRGGSADEDLLAVIETLESIDEQRNSSINVLRDRWLRGLLCMTLDRLDESVAILRATMRGFDAQGHTDSALRVGTDAVRALLAAERFVECIELASDLASRSIGLEQREPTRRHALTAEALSYLRDAAQRQLLTSDLAASVATYIDRITQQRPVDFVPPMPLREM